MPVRWSATHHALRPWVRPLIQPLKRTGPEILRVRGMEEGEVATRTIRQIIGAKLDQRSDR